MFVMTVHCWTQSKFVSRCLLRNEHNARALVQRQTVFHKLNICFTGKVENLRNM